MLQIQIMRVKSKIIFQRRFLVVFSCSDINFVILPVFACNSFYLLIFLIIFFASGFALLLLQFLFCFWLLVHLNRKQVLEEGVHLHSLLVNWFVVTDKIIIVLLYYSNTTYCYIILHCTLITVVSFSPSAGSKAAPRPGGIDRKSCV